MCALLGGPGSVSAPSERRGESHSLTGSTVGRAVARPSAGSADRDKSGGISPDLSHGVPDSAGSAAGEGWTDVDRDWDQLGSAVGQRPGRVNVEAEAAARAWECDAAMTWMVA